MSSSFSPSPLRGAGSGTRSSGLKFVIFGLTVSSSWGNGHATLWRGLIRALTAHGHRVVFFERDVPYYAEHRDLEELPDGALRLYSDWDSIRDEARREADEADVCIVTSYCPDGIAAGDLILSSKAAVKLFYDLDTPVTLDRLRRGETVEYIGPRGLRDYDLVLSFTDGPVMREMADRLGARRVLPLYGSVDPAVHHPTEPSDAYQSDLSYLGTYAADRQAALEELFIKPAKQKPDMRFLIGGAMYPREFPWTDNIFFVPHVPPADHPAFFSSSRLTLNVTRQAMAAMGYCPSGRLFEAAACGAPILSDWWDGLDSFFTPGIEILVGKTAADTVNALSLTDAELYRVGQAARERVLAENTADHRARELVDAVMTSATRAGRAIPAGMPTVSVDDSQVEISRAASREFLRHCAED